MVMRTVGIVHLTVAMTVRNENWNENSTAGQLHREAGEAAVKQLRDMVERTRSVELVGGPHLIRVYTEESK